MPADDVMVPTPDGECAVSLHRPDGKGPWPGVIMYPDAGGIRATFRDMGERLSELGYVVAVPDIFYRSGGYEPFDMATVFTDPGERKRLGTLVAGLPTASYLADAGAFLDHLEGRDDVAAVSVGITGYCMGGRMALNVAGQFGERVGAAASFHGGNLAVEDDPESPHRSAPGIAAEVYVGVAENDRSFPAEQADLLRRTFDDAGVTCSIEQYAAPHGFAVPDNPTYDVDAARRHWSALQQLFGAALVPSSSGPSTP